MQWVPLFDSVLPWQVTLTLLHVSWIGLAIGIVAVAGNRLLQTASASRRYRWNLGALLLLGASLPLTFSLVRAWSPAAEAAPTPGASARPSTLPGASGTLEMVAPVDTPAAPTALPTDTSREPREARDGSDRQGFLGRIHAAAPFVVLIYVLGVVAMLTKLIVAIWGGKRLRNACLPIVDRKLVDLVARQARRLALSATPALARCERVAVPVVIGVLRPMILLPALMIGGLTQEQLAAVVTHELAHIRRYDHLLILVQRLIEALLFFHPATWYLSRRIHDERESCCDDLVLAAGSDRLGYVTSLLRVAELRLGGDPRWSREVAALAADGGRPSRLRQRILRLLGEADEPAVRISRAGIVTTLGLIALSAALCLAPLFSSLKAEQERVPYVPRERFIGTLPDGTSIELVGVGFHPSTARPWWKPDGSPLATRPYDTPNSHVYPDPENSREFSIRLTNFRSGIGTHCWFEPGVGASAWGMELDGVKPGEPTQGRINIAAGSFEGRKTTTLEVALTADLWGPVQRVSRAGLLETPDPIAKDLNALYGRMRPRTTGETEGKGCLFVTWVGGTHITNDAELELSAVDAEGGKHRSNRNLGREREQDFVFDLPLAQIDHFEYRLRPYVHRVIFDNVSLHPDRPTEATVRVESSEAPETTKDAAGKGAPRDEFAAGLDQEWWFFRGKNALTAVDRFKPSWGDSQEGVQLGLACIGPTNRFARNELVPVALFFRNVSEEALRLKFAGGDHDLDLRDADGDPLPVERTLLAGVNLIYRETLKPNEAIAFRTWGLALGRERETPFSTFRWPVPRGGKHALHARYRLEIAPTSGEGEGRSLVALSGPMAFEVAPSPGETNVKEKGSLDILIAEHVILWDGEILTWEEVVDRLRVIRKKSGKPIHPRFRFTNGAAAQKKHEVYQQKANAVYVELFEPAGMSVGFVSPRAADRFDRIREPADLVPKPELVRTGVVLTPAGRPAWRATVLLMPEKTVNPVTIIPDVTLNDPRVLRDTLNEEWTMTDKEGRFRIAAPDTGCRLAVFSPQGFAIVPVPKVGEPVEITLTPRSELEVASTNQSKQTLDIQVNVPELPESAGFTMYGVVVEKEPKVILLPPGRVIVSRSFDVGEGRSVGVQAETFALKPGEKKTLALPPPDPLKIPKRLP